MEKETIVNKWCWHNWICTCRRLHIDPYLSRCTNLKSKWIKDLNINAATLNLPEEKLGGTLEQIGTGEGFPYITPVAKTLKSTIKKWCLLKLRRFCKAKETVSKPKRQSTELEKIFTIWQKADHENITISQGATYENTKQGNKKMEWILPLTQE